MVSIRARFGAEAEPQGAAIGRYSIPVPGGGVIWATEDPALGQPQMNVSAPSEVAFSEGRIAEPVRFYAYNNYPAFLRRAEILVFRAQDVDLVTPLARIDLPVGAVGEVEWDGALTTNAAIRAGEELVYIVRAWGDGEAFDETYPRRIRLVTPEEAAHRSSLARTEIERRFGEAFSVDEAMRRDRMDAAMGENALRLRNIPVYGSRIRIQGRNLPEGMTARINGRDHPIDLERRLAAEYLAPIGTHDFVVDMVGGGLEPATETLSVDVTGRYSFIVGIADLTLSQNNVSGSLETQPWDERFDDDFLVEGRLAFYLLEKFRGRYLLTAQADTQERELDDLFDGFWEADPQDVFRRLDPDLYYPVYGDDSTIRRDVDTQGRLYARLDWDQNQILFGNYETRFIGTELAQFSRSLYGAAAALRTPEATALGEPVGELRAFAASIQTAPGHVEFLGTGASLYFLRDTDILPGSEEVAIEVRDPTTGRVERRTYLLPGADYELDELQGRILLTRPLAPVTREGVTGLTTDTPLDGFLQVLVVDYEYVPDDFDPDSVGVGVRGRRWLGEHVALGGTYVEESRDGDDYSLVGVDLMLRAGRGAYLSLEHSRTENTGVPVYFSNDGGLSFNQTNAAIGAREGEATAVEGRLNLREMGYTRDEWALGAWWRSIDGGFSIARYDMGEPVEEYGAEIVGELGPTVSLYSRYSHAERGQEALTQAQITGEWRFSETASIGAEVRSVDETRLTGSAAGMLTALRYTQRVTPSLELYGQGQMVLDDDGGRYASNDAVTVGASWLYGEQSSLNAEATTGDRGNAARLLLEHRLNPDNTLYAGYTVSTDRTDYDPLFSTRADDGWVVGQRWRLSNRTNLYNERQYLRTNAERGLAHTVGLDFYPTQGWNAGLTYTQADLERAIGGGLFDSLEREALSVSVGHTSPETQWLSKFEWRVDSGAEDRTQWITTNRLLHRINESLRLAVRINASETEDQLNPAAGARFFESNAGFAYRPWNSTEWALFGRHTYLYDISALSQVGDDVALYDQKTQVWSLEGVWNPDPRWEVAAHVAQRQGEVRFGRMEGDWADSGAFFAAGQVRLEIDADWHALAEYRHLSVEDGGVRQGVLIGVDRDIGDHLRIGVGYNFTDFSDDLTDFDYDHEGLYLNVVGRF